MPVDMSAGIFVVLALGWAGYLIPKALKHHDEVASTRSIDKVSHTMRVLSRREEPTPDPVVAPPVRSTKAQRRAAAAAARRRRRILVVLLLANVIVGLVVFLGYAERWAIAIPAGLAVAYLVLCRTIVKREHSAYDAQRVREHIARRKAEIAVEDAADLVEPAEPVGVRARNDQGFEEVTPTEDTTSIDVSALAPAVGEASLWDPLPVTLPTYVGKPKAARTVRTIDLSDPSISNSGRDAADSQLVADTEQAQADAAQSDGPTQRAVNS